jgi:hypothetical protein
LAVTLAAFGDAGNATFGAIAQRLVAAITFGTGFTELYESGTVENSNFQTQWRNDNDTSVDWSWTGNQAACAVAVEIKAEAAATTAPYAPTGLTATGSGDSISLSWTDTNSGATQYRIYGKRTTDSQYSWLGDTVEGAESFVHDWLVADTSYDYRVTAWDLTNESEYASATGTTEVVLRVSGSFL